LAHKIYFRRQHFFLNKSHFLNDKKLVLIRPEHT
jgi:hypothetical protein